MEITERTEYRDITSEYAVILSEMLEEYSEDDLAELLCECETLLQTNDIYMTKLNERGLKRLFNLIAGIERKCNRRLMDNFQVIHKITLNVEKVILSRVTNLRRLVCSLNDKHEEDNRFTQYCINSLLQMVKDQEKHIGEVQRKEGLMEWERYGLKDYESYSDTKKVLQIVSDLYVRTDGKFEMNPGLLQKALENLKVSDTPISPDSFANEIIRDVTCLPLYIKNELNNSVYQADISPYGVIICQVNTLVTDRNVQKLCEARNESLESFCQPLLSKIIADRNMDTMSGKDICEKLLGDMKKLHEIAECESLKEREMAEEDRNRRESEEKKQEEQKLLEPECQNYSVLRITPEEIHLVRDGKAESVELRCKKERNHEYVLKNEEEKVRKSLEENSPYLVTAPSAYVYRYAMPEIRTRIAMNSKYISLSDYYMYLWFRNTKEKERANKKVVFISYYMDALFATAYFVYESGEGYKKEFLKKMPHGWSIAGMIKEIKSCKYFEKIPKEEILMFQTFESDVQNLWKLKKEQGVKMVESAWEDILQVDNRELRDVIRDMIDRTNEAIIRN